MCYNTTTSLKEVKLKFMKGGNTFLCEHMKTAIKKQNKYLITMLMLIFICEIMLQVNNNVLQILGICIVPFIVVFGVLLLTSDKK